MIRLPTKNGVDAIELFQQDDEGEFMLKSERAQREDMIRLVAQ